MLDHQVLGWLAAALTLATFVCHDMRRLRLLALGANAAFIGYGAAAQLMPVLILHLVLVPVNLWRLSQAFTASAPQPPRQARVASMTAPKRRQSTGSRRSPASRAAEPAVVVGWSLPGMAAAAPRAIATSPSTPFKGGFVRQRSPDAGRRGQPPRAPT